MGKQDKRINKQQQQQLKNFIVKEKKVKTKYNQDIQVSDSDESEISCNDIAINESIKFNQLAASGFTEKDIESPIDPLVDEYEKALMNETKKIVPVKFLEPQAIRLSIHSQNKLVSNFLNYGSLRPSQFNTVKPLSISFHYRGVFGDECNEIKQLKSKKMLTLLKFHEALVYQQKLNDNRRANNLQIPAVAPTFQKLKQILNIKEDSFKFFLNNWGTITITYNYLINNKPAFNKCYIYGSNRQNQLWQGKVEKDDFIDNRQTKEFMKELFSLSIGLDERFQNFLIANAGDVSQDDYIGFIAVQFLTNNMNSEEIFVVPNNQNL